MKNLLKLPCLIMYTIWDDVRTYLTISIDPQEKTALQYAISYFKKKEEIIIENPSITLKLAENGDV